MRIIKPALALPISLMAVCVGCQSEDQLKRVEQELGDVKVQIFQLKQQVEEGNRKADADRAAEAEARGLDRRFQADVAETLRQLQDTTRVLNRRMDYAPKAGGAPKTDGAPVAVTADDEKAFSAAVLDYNRGNYALAADSLDVFIKSHPGSAKKPDALFFLGLAHYNQKAFDKAQVVFEQLIRESPSSNQFLPAKLKRAQCLGRQNLKPAAVRAYKELVDGFSGTPEARTAQQELADLGL
ncbi:MAG: tetratricopeptide repeat protein [Holophagaceae bacterium]|nr:tetratricopeptide repeat protein [Holophagaceae bacterium]